MQKYHDEPKQYKGYLKSALANYGHLHPLAKIVLTLAMWIGRLEVLTVLALLRWEVWRSSHWRGIPSASR